MSDGLRRHSAAPARLTDVAALAGVSIATASQALNGGAVAARTRTRVRDAAVALRYVPRVSAQTLRTGRAVDIGLRVLTTPDSAAWREASFFYSLIRGALVGADEARLHLSLQFIDIAAGDTGAILAAEAAARRFGAVIVVPQRRHDDSCLGPLQAQGTPVVVINDPASRADTVVAVDDAHGMALAIDHLSEQGHQHLGYLAGPPGHLDAEARLGAFYRLCAERGLRVEPNTVLRTGDFAIAAGRSTFADYLSRLGASQALPTGWLAADDYIAAGAMQAAQAVGLRVPEDFSLVGYGDIELAQATAPPLTSVHLPMYEIGYQAARAAAVLARQGQDTPRTRRTILPTLTERATVRPTLPDKRRLVSVVRPVAPCP